MNNYEKFVTEINNIFAIIEKTKTWDNNDNSALIDEINAYKKSVIHAASLIQKLENSGSNKGMMK